MDPMNTATISDDYTVQIPPSIRDALRLAPGQRVAFFAIDGRAQMIPIRPARELRGMLRGLANDFEREPDRL
jgi:bifunctional DNA-binding transcriptional regulator/antitoxin component of YhaV-PrlF toxin-antitoxin module